MHHRTKMMGQGSYRDQLMKGIDYDLGLSRFSSDMDTIDDDLPFIMNIFLSEAFEMLGTLVVLVISQPLLAVAFVPLAFIYRWIQVDPHAL